MVGFITKLSAIERLLLFSRRLKHFVTAPIFYANGPPHIGHLYSALLADAFHRWELLKDGCIYSYDSKSLFTIGTDEHGLKIQRTAKAIGCDPQSYCDGISSKFRDLLRSFNVEPSDFIRTTERRHVEVVRRVWKELSKRGQIERSNHEGWYSATDECFYGIDEVEEKEQRLMVSKITGSTVEWTQEENYVFPLHKYLDAVRNWLKSNDIIRPKLYLSDALRQIEAKGFLSLSRDKKRVSWGIAVPDDDNQTVYVWFDALVSYLTVSGMFSEKETCWPPTCHVIGKDILKFHAVIWPAFLLALDIPLPERIFVHSHWLVDGAKMSKSVGNVIDPFIAAKTLTEEGLRYFLLRQGTPQSDSNFMMLKAVNVINADLVNNIGNLLQRALVEKLNPTVAYPYFYSDSFRNDLLRLGGPLVDSLNCLAGAYSEHFNNFMVHQALELLTEVVRHANGFFQFYEPWKELDEKKVCSLLYICCEVLRVSGILLQPVLPQYACRLLNRLGINKDERGLDNAKFIIDSRYSGRPFGKSSEPIMKRITWQITFFH